MTVGYSAVQAIVGNKLSPRFADWYLKKMGFSGQQMQDKPVSPDRPDNLYEPVVDLAATHGIFDAKAKTRSPQLWVNTHWGATAGAVLGAGALLAGAVNRAR